MGTLTKEPLPNEPTGPAARSGSIPYFPNGSRPCLGGVDRLAYVPVGSSPAWLAEAYGSRTHPRHPTVPRNGFEDRETHRDPSAPNARTRLYSILCTS